jgi:hypothetical protein
MMLFLNKFFQDQLLISTILSLLLVKRKTVHFTHFGAKRSCLTEKCRFNFPRGRITGTAPWLACSILSHISLVSKVLWVHKTPNKSSFCTLYLSFWGSKWLVKLSPWSDVTFFVANPWDFLLLISLRVLTHKVGSSCDWNFYFAFCNRNTS